jgi:PPIC-type PPIASE domain
MVDRKVALKSVIAFAILLVTPLSSCQLPPSAPRQRDTGATVPGGGPEVAAPRAEPSNVSQTSGAALSADAVRYPPARWRLAALPRLDSVLINFSHILIRHADISDTQATLTPADWFVPYPKVTRSKEEALRFVRELADRIQGGEPFGEVARQASEDPLTASRGGGLGGQSAAQLRMWPEVLDALAQVRIGEVTRPLSLPDGVHLFVRDSLPPLRSLSGRRLVIGHKDAPWLQFNTRKELVARTRDEALELARQIQSELAAHPQRFEARVRELSEHLDAERGGDIGEWSSREPSLLWRELQVIGELQVGEVSAPMDGLFGIEILQRTELRPRQTYAVDLLRLGFAPSAPSEHPASQQHVFELAQRLATSAAAQPEQFSEYQDQYCCRGVERTVEGRGWPALDVALSKLEPGQVALAPVLGEASQWLVVKRLREVPTIAPIEFELPAPERPDIEYFAVQDGALADQAFARVREDVDKLGLSEALVGKARVQLDSMGRLEALPAEARPSALERCSQGLREVLGSENQKKLSHLLDQQFERILLASESGP